VAKSELSASTRKGEEVSGEARTSAEVIRDLRVAKASHSGSPQVQGVSAFVRLKRGQA